MYKQYSFSQFSKKYIGSILGKLGPICMGVGYGGTSRHLPHLGKNWPYLSSKLPYLGTRACSTRPFLTI